MSKLVRWAVPFADAFYPSVASAFSQASKYQINRLRIVVTSGVNEYPKYLVSFSDVLVFNCFDEGCAPERKWPEVEVYDPKPCAWIWTESPWVASYQGCGNFDENDQPFPLYHYLIFGGDYNVEVVARNEPSIETITEPGQIAIKFSF
jgi:hypothetical protein